MPRKPLGEEQIPGSSIDVRHRSVPQSMQGIEAVEPRLDLPASERVLNPAFGDALPNVHGRRLLASLERCGRRGIRLSKGVSFLLTLLRRLLLLLSFFGFRGLVAHGAPPTDRVSNERIGYV